MTTLGQMEIHEPIEPIGLDGSWISRPEKKCLENGLDRKINTNIKSYWIESKQQLVGYKISRKDFL